MTRVRRMLFTALVPAVVLASAMAASAVGTPQDKVAICHVTGNGGTHQISVSGNALQAHLGHGDSLPDEYGDCLS